MTIKNILRLITLSLTLFTWCAALSADEYSKEWGPTVGEPLPLLEAPDQSGATRTLDDLKGKQGLLLFMNRSADW
ncbi:MAG: hypothetical protein AAF387_11100 [Pseudomonadota bacterium]